MSPALPTEKPALRRLRGLVLLALVALAAWLLARLVLALAVPDSRYLPVRTAAPAQASQSAVASYDFSTNPFAAGDVEEADAGPDLSNDAPETTLNLTLTGRRAGPNGAAYIRTPDGNEDTYYIDDTVMNGVVLRRVLPTYVLLDVNGQAQRLTLEEVKQDRRNAGQTAETARQLSTLKSLSAEDLLRQFNVDSVKENGQTVGVTLSPRSSGIDIRDYGFRRGDVFTQIGSRSLAVDRVDLAALRREVSSGRPVTVSFLRDGEPMSLTLGGRS